ncbi:hypothetical protein EVAR_26028_1 [Eumeta japonica]|uniref:CWF21 domain-containing protein n=1 Tax=Eumeta variegata TaxID=151549 RepID=A0A4C1VRF0_EUMVA|nr:hypothetical protein EVAR_26028_1 [Eumeta japonica]
MYNGIGLQTPRGSGTNGYVQKNWATVRMPKDRVNYRTEEEIAKLDSASNKPPNREILDHERKRKIEVKCTELEDSLEEQGASLMLEAQVHPSHLLHLLVLSPQCFSLNPKFLGL